MIGRWLALLTEQEEDNLLTTKLVPFTNHAPNTEMGCLVGVTLKHQAWGGAIDGAPCERWAMWCWWNGSYHPMRDNKNIAYRFNELCQKLVGVPVQQRLPFTVFRNTPHELEGGARAARLIRARILRHRAQRALATVAPSRTAELVEVT